MITTLEIVDSAVKIGLGAMISSVTSWYVTRMKHAHDLTKAKLTDTSEQQKEREKRQREVLEKVAEQVEAFNHVALKYIALTTEWVKRRDNGLEMSESRRAELDKVSPELFNSFKDLLCLCLAARTAASARRSVTRRQVCAAP